MLKITTLAALALAAWAAVCSPAHAQNNQPLIIPDNAATLTPMQRQQQLMRQQQQRVIDQMAQVNPQAAQQMADLQRQLDQQMDQMQAALAMQLGPNIAAAEAGGGAINGQGAQNGWGAKSMRSTSSSDGVLSLTLSESNDNGAKSKSLIVKDVKTGVELFHGPIDTDEQRKAIPLDVLPKVEAMEKKMN
jgi:hypothetical protein